MFRIGLAEENVLYPERLDEGPGTVILNDYNKSQRFEILN